MMLASLPVAFLTAEPSRVMSRWLLPCGWKA